MRKIINSFIYVIWALIVLVPLALIVLLALSQRWAYPALWPTQFSSMATVLSLLTSTEVLSSLGASVALAVGTIGLTLLIAYPTAMALTYYQFPGKKWLNLLIYLPLIIPGIALLTNIDFVIIKLNLNGRYFGIIAVHSLFCLPYAIKLLSDNLKLVGPQYAAVSQNLGASHWQTFWQITVPLSKNGLQGAVMMTYIVSMTQYLATLLIGEGNYLTLSVRMFPFTQAGKYQLAAIYAIVFMLVTLVPLFLIDSWLAWQERSREAHVSIDRD
ncbi:ABC transporter permease [Loigolactobacillus jiayinensis]|uniref:ABC transporter permease n=1 Tax=Loigolactobacillus jiayinensis TaxID=2486016 RepID=A0ABW1RC09_9LACO|nr:ABC transporter permease subunit [Loigolactobacillus jiayinensis]